MVDLYIGHILPGVGYLIYATWWSLTTSIRFVHHDHSLSMYKSSVAMPALFLPRRPTVLGMARRASFESCFRFVCSLVGLVFHPMDAYSDYTRALDDSRLPIGNATDGGDGDQWLMLLMVFRVKHHFALYLAFAFGSLVEILIHCGVPFPRNLDRAMLIMPFAFEAFIFSQHFEGRKPNSVDTALHMHLVVAVIGCVLFCILEAYNERQVLFSYGRCLFTALQGTWFIQIAVSLYLPYRALWFLRWDIHNAELIPDVTFCFCMHFYAIFVFLCVELAVVRFAMNTQFNHHRRSKAKVHEYLLKTFPGSQDTEHNA